MNWHDRIVSDPEILVGKPTIRGTRISVELVLDPLADGWTVDEALSAYPELVRDDVPAALAFVAEIYKEESFVARDKASA